MILNLGCGRDHESSKGVIGLDIRPPADVLGDARRLPFPDSSFTTVRCHQVLEHLPPPDTIGAWNEVWRVLEPGGVFWGDVPGIDLNLNMAVRDPTHLSFYSADTFVYLCGPEGTLVEEAHHAGRTARWTWAESQNEGVFVVGDPEPWAYHWKVRADK